MTPTAHNRLLGTLHLFYGAFSFLLMIAVTIIVVGMVGAAASDRLPREAVPIGVFALIIVGLVLLNLIISIPSFIAGYGLLRRRRWARTIGIIAGIIAALTFPFGTALCVYTLWFFFGERGRFLYHKAAYALPPGAPLAGKLRRRAEPEYIPPPAPPDWR
jgi:hypothetical protein